MRRPDHQKVVFHADDLGLSLGFNRGILEAAQLGVLTSTCIRTNGAAYRSAIEDTIPKMKHVKIGVHLNIVEGHSFLPPGAARDALCRPSGAYRLGFFGLLLRSFSPKFLEAVEVDFRDQIERVLGDLGAIDHLNSHQHSHAIPSLFRIVCRLAEEYGIPAIRLPQEKFYFAGPLWRHLRLSYLANLVKWTVLNILAVANRATIKAYRVVAPRSFVGILYTGTMTAETIVGGVDRAAKAGTVIEVLLHPARILGRRDEAFLDANVRDYVLNFDRHAELAALTSDAVRSLVDSKAILPSDMAGNPVAIPDVSATSQEQTRRLRVVVVFDETPFFQPMYFQELLRAQQRFEIVGSVVIVLPKGGKLQPYLLKNWKNLGLSRLFRLSLISVAFRLLDRLPRRLRGDFTASIRRLSEESGLPTLVADNVRSAATKAWVRALDPDIVLSSNSCIFDQEFIELPKIALINRHSALLPSYGGILPVFRSVQFGETHTGASVHHVVKGIDKGAVIARKAVEIFPGDTLFRLYRLCFIASVVATIEAVERLADDPGAALTDSEYPESYFSFPSEDDWATFRRRNIPFV